MMNYLKKNDPDIFADKLIKFSELRYFSKHTVSTVELEK